MPPPRLPSPFCSYECDPGLVHVTIAKTDTRTLRAVMIAAMAASVPREHHLLPIYVRIDTRPCVCPACASATRVVSVVREPLHRLASEHLMLFLRDRTPLPRNPPSLEELAMLTSRHNYQARVLLRLNPYRCEAPRVTPSDAHALVGRARAGEMHLFVFEDYRRSVRGILRLHGVPDVVIARTVRKRVTGAARNRSADAVVQALPRAVRERIRTHHAVDALLHSELTTLAKAKPDA